VTARARDATRSVAGLRSATPPPRIVRLGRDVSVADQPGKVRQHGQHVVQTPDHVRLRTNAYAPGRVAFCTVASRSSPGGVPLGDGDQIFSPPMRTAMIAFWTCRRFSASSQTRLCGPSITESLTSSPRCAGRQWRKIAFLSARFISASST